MSITLHASSASSRHVFLRFIYDSTRVIVSKYLSVFGIGQLLVGASD